MTIAEYCELTHEEVSDNVLLACSILQAKGYEFGGHFGTQNAIEFAEMALRGERLPTWTPSVEGK